MQNKKKQLKSRKLCFHFCHLSLEMLKSTINQCQRKTSDHSDLKVMSVHQFSFNQVNNNLAGNKMKMKCLEILLASKKKHLTISETAAIQPHMDWIHYDSTNCTVQHNLIIGNLEKNSSRIQTIQHTLKKPLMKWNNYHRDTIRFTLHNWINCIVRTAT